MKIVYKIILVFWLPFLLSSCNWKRCKVEGLILVSLPELQQYESGYCIYAKHGE